MSRFKIGDRVRIVAIEKGDLPDVQRGQEFTIYKDYDDFYGYLRSDNDGDFFSEEQLELVGPGFLYNSDGSLKVPQEEPKKYNEGKPRTDLISGEFILGLGKALEYGANKYDESKEDTPNYLKADGFLYSDLIGALERHMAKFKSGTNVDEESGLEHILQVAVNAMFLYNYRISGKGIDNRVVLNEVHKS